MSGWKKDQPATEEQPRVPSEAHVLKMTKAYFAGLAPEEPVDGADGTDDDGDWKDWPASEDEGTIL